jgi:hypothetical protein
MNAPPRSPPPASPRRWFNFSLRTMFVLVTLLSCWLAWETSVVRHRKAVLDGLKTNGAIRFTTAKAWEERYPGGSPLGRPARISLVRQWLGDEAIQEIQYQSWFYVEFVKVDLAEVKRAFPEAELREGPLPEPCHPGCFPRGTLIETPAGPRPIESIQQGDSIAAFRASGEAFVATVQSVFITENRLWQIETEAGTLITTQTQPLCLATDRTAPAGALMPGDSVLYWVNGEIQPVKVRRVSATNGREKVFNVVLGDRELFIANGFLARSKPPPVVVD